MKKNLSIFLSFISLTAFSEVTYEEAVIENLQDMGSNVSDLETNVQLIHDNLNYYLFSDEYNNFLENLYYLFYYDLEENRTWLEEYYPFLTTVSDMVTMQFEKMAEYYPYFSQTLNDSYTQQNQFYDYLYQYSLGSNIESSKVALESISSSVDNLKIAVTQLGDKYDQIIVNGNNTSDDLQTIIAELQKLNGGSESDFPVESLGYYQLVNIGKNVSINHLPLQELETTGEYNKDVHRMLLNLNRLGSSQNNAALSILTNVQVIATALSQDAEGQDKLEKDLEDKEYQATKVEAELSGVTSQNWDSSFTPPRYLSEVHGRLSIDLSDSGLPSEITVMDKFYYNTAYFTLEIDPLSFQIPQPLVDLANYGRIVFGFVYWTLTFFLALYLFRLWVRLYMYVSNTLINR